MTITRLLDTTDLGRLSEAELIEQVLRLREQVHRLEVRAGPFQELLRDITQLTAVENDRESLIGNVCQKISWATASPHVGIWIEAADGGSYIAFEVRVDGARSTKEYRQSQPPLCWTRVRGRGVSQVLEPPDWSCRDCCIGSQLGDRRVTIPLLHGQTFYGVLCFATTPAVHDSRDHLADVLDELAGKISFGLHKIVILEAREKAELARRESEARLRSIFRVAPVGIGLAVDGTLVEVNRKICEMLGRDAGELVGQKVAILYHDRHVPEDGMTDASAMEMRWRRRDGQPIDVLLSATAFDSDVVDGVTFAALDISARKEAERALRLTQYSVDHSPNAVFWLRRDGSIQEVNNASCSHLGYSRAELLELSVFDLDATMTRDGWAVQWAKVKRLGVLSGETEHRRGDGSRCPVELTYSYVEFEGQQLIFAIAADIAERKQAEAKLLASRQQLRAMATQLSVVEERERRQFALFLHDQIGQILAVLKMKIGSLAAEEADPTLRDIRELLEQAITETQSLTFDLSPPILYELGLEPALEWIAEKVVRGQDLELSFYDDGAVKPLDADVAPFLFRATRELLLNVVKHARATRVEVSVRRVGAMIRVEVADDGVGFDMARRVGPSATGFGLFSIRERLDHLRGQLVLESEPGHGCRVILMTYLKQQPLVIG